MEVATGLLPLPPEPPGVLLMCAVDFTSTRATVVLLRNARAAAQARRVLAAVCTGDALSEDAAALLLSEVVSNAVRHAKGSTIKVVVSRDEVCGSVTGAVFDSTAGMGEGQRRGDGPLGELETGRGLDILDALADEWGVTRAGGSGKWVWFRIAGRGRSRTAAAS
ncbi:ATP-binding protein [Streptomyces sp. NPDC001262]|uniref:ATP-binding protein n=1 Tax=Streptomyces sp. NPDC001262 TaxID=3364552 RepID=UPI0036BAA3F2